MNRERVRHAAEFDRSSHPPIGSGGGNLGQTVGAQQYKPSPEEIAEMKAERERGLDLTIRNSAVQLAIQTFSGCTSTAYGDATLVELAQDLYSFLKGTK